MIKYHNPIRHPIVCSVWAMILFLLFFKEGLGFNVCQDKGEDEYLLRYRLPANRCRKYRMTVKQKTDMENMGQAMTVVVNIQIIYTIKGKAVEDKDNLLSTITLDTLAFKIEGIPEDISFNTTPFSGKSFKLAFTPLGEELEFTGIDSLPKIDLSRIGGGKQDITSFLRHPFPDLPFQSVKIGDSWPGTGQFTRRQQGLNITVKTDGMNIAEGHENLDGWNCLRVKTRATGTLDGLGEQMGMDVVFEGDMENTIEWHFAHEEGVLVRMISEQFMEGTIMLTGQVDMAVPMRQVTTVESQLMGESEEH